MSEKKVIDKFQPAEDRWEHRAGLEGLRPVLDPFDCRGKNNAFIDMVHKKAVSRHCYFSGKHRVLDFGCGIGRLTKWLSSLGQYVVGIEITKEMLDKAKLYSKSSNVDFILYDGSNLCFRRECFDIILSVWVLQHMPNETVTNIIKQMVDCILKKDSVYG